MDWLEQLAAERREKDPSYAEVEARIEAENGGYEVELVGDASGHPLSSPVLVAAGDANGVYRL